MRSPRAVVTSTPRCSPGFAPGVLPLTVEEGIADGVSQVRRAVRYQIKYGAKQIKVCASGGVMSLTGTAGAQHYSDEELRAIVDEAHRRGMRVAAHAHGDQGIRAAIEAGIDCIEHASLMSEETQKLVLERGTFIVPTSYLSEGMDVSNAAPELQAKAAEVFPIAKKTIARLIDAGAKIATGTDAPAIPHGQNCEGAVGAGPAGHAPGRRHRGVDGDQRGARPRRRPRSAGARSTSPTSSRCPATPPKTSPSPKTCSS